MARAAGYSVTALAKLRGVGVRQLEREFQAKHNQTPQRWLHRLRLELALDFLLGGCTVKETALELGYTQPQNFARAFKKFFGMVPSKASDAQTHVRRVHSQPGPSENVVF